jgi:hypothetical protein
VQQAQAFADVALMFHPQPAFTPRWLAAKWWGLGLRAGLSIAAVALLLDRLSRAALQGTGRH